jgi:hypothetical protein
VIDQPPVRIKKDLPSFLVVPVLQPAQQRLPGRNHFLNTFHSSCCYHFATNNTLPQGRFFQETFRAVWQPGQVPPHPDLTIVCRLTKAF